MRHKTLLILISAVLLIAGSCPLWAQSTEAPVQYRLDLRDPGTHLVHVTMEIPQAPQGLEIQFPAWNNLYQIRDFVHDVQDLTATCHGRPVALRSVDIETWAAPTPCDDLMFHYAVYADQPGPFSAQLDSQHAFLNFALLLFYLPKDRSRAVRVRVDLPDGWQLATMLDSGPQPGEYQAQNYDRLGDSPALAGQFAEYDYRQRDAEYRVIVNADTSDYYPKKLVGALKKITATETAMMRDVPFNRYTFMFQFLDSRVGGGMEHAFGTAISIPANEVRSDPSVVDGIAAHEFFHLWNVKRIRPQALEPIDYVHGNDTRDLWFSEGVTSTYGELTLLRSRLIGRKDFYRHVAGEILQLRSRPARFYQSAIESGRDAWLEKYPDYFRPERSISYYNKGELLGDLLDLGILHGSGARHSLDDLMRRLNVDFAQRGRYFTEQDLLTIVEQLAPGFDAAKFFRDDVDGTKPLDFARFFSYAGLQLETRQVQAPDLGFKSLKSFVGPVRVESVEPQSPAARAGIEPGDVLTKMNGSYLVQPPEQEIEGMKPGDQVVFTVERNGKTLDVTFPLGSKPAEVYGIREMKDITPEQRAVRRGWLEGKTQGSTSMEN